MRAKTKNLLVLAALALSTYTGWAQTKTTSPQPIPRAISFDVAKQIKHVETKLRLSLAQLKDTTRFARNVAINGTQWETTKYTDWTSGFFAGTLWYMYDLTQDPYWRTQAERWQAAVEPAKNITWTHDLGFMVYNCYGLGYKFTKEPHYKEVVMAAAESLNKLYNPKVGTTKSWTWRKDWMHPTIIDNMLNLELLFWAGKNGGRRIFYDNAYQHAQVTQKEHLRPDFTSYHVVNYDTATGQPLQKKTDQGLADNSTWARGQAWGIYGFALAHRETKDRRFLVTAKQMAEVFIKNLPEDQVPYWDFNAPRTAAEPRDASAAAIAASGMLELANLCKEPMDKYYFRQQATKILAALSTSTYLAGPQNPAVLQHCTGSKPHKSEIDVSLVYADYYYLEALHRLVNYAK